MAEYDGQAALGIQFFEQGLPHRSVKPAKQDRSRKYCHEKK